MTLSSKTSTAARWTEEVEGAYGQHVQITTFENARPDDAKQVVGLKIAGPRGGIQAVVWFWPDDRDALDELINALEAARAALGNP